MYLLLQDRFADKKALPPIDEQQDYELTGFQESGGKTVLKFKRKFDTCDPRDIKLEVSISILSNKAFRDVACSMRSGSGERREEKRLLFAPFPTERLEEAIRGALMNFMHYKTLNSFDCGKVLRSG